MKIILDTNFLLIPFTNHIDIFAELEKMVDEKVGFVVLSQSIQELKSLKGKQRMAGRAMVDFIAKQSDKFEILSIQGKTDELISKIANAQKPQVLVATMDKDLRDRLKKEGIRTVLVRGKGHLEIK